MTLRIASLGVAVVALVLLGRMAVFMADAEQTQLSIEPADRWRTAHSCLTAYAEAARFAGEGDHNVYDTKLYTGRKLGGLRVDDYHYPPTFLLVPGAMQRLAGGYLELRAPWFLMQLGLLIFAAWLIARWLGGEMRRDVLGVAPLFFITPALLFTLQMGNFQSTAFALALIGMVALSSSRVAVQLLGGISLALATASKVFPGILVVYLIVTRRWRALAWTAGAGLAIVALALAVYGTRPFHDFVSFELPRLSSGEAFPQSELPNTAAGNMSFYGLLVKLRTLGVDALDHTTGLMLTSIYGFVVIALAVVVAWRRRGDLVEPAARLEELQLWFALVNLASYRSPFVGGPYGLIGTVWLSVIMIGAAATVRARIGWSAVLAVLVAGSLLMPTPIAVPTLTQVAQSASLQTFMIAVNLWICGAALLRRTRPMLRP